MQDQDRSWILEEEQKTLTAFRDPREVEEENCLTAGVSIESSWKYGKAPDELFPPSTQRRGVGEGRFDISHARAPVWRTDSLIA